MVNKKNSKNMCAKRSKSKIINSKSSNINKQLASALHTPQILKERLSDFEKNKIDNALCEFFFGCNISLNVVESIYFKNLIRSLVPSAIYNPPTRKTLSTTLLDKYHENCTTKHMSSDATDGVLLIDGWKNSSANKKNVVCTIHTVGSKSLFLKSWDMTGTSESGDELKKIIDEAKILAKKKFNIIPYSVVSDNASPMIKMGKNIDIWHITCNSHSGNRLALSLVPEDFAKNINKLLRQFKTPDAEDRIKKQGGSKIILACDTRWCSYRDAFRCLLKNLKYMKALVNENKISLAEKYKKQLEDPTFEIQLQDYILIFDPICELINKCQATDCSLADAGEEWMKIIIPCENEKFEKVLNARLKKVLTKFILSSNLLHPKYHGKRFKDDAIKMETALNFIETELTQDGLTSSESSALTNSILEIELDAKLYILDDWDKLKVLIKHADDADDAGKKTEAIRLYKEAAEMISNIVKVTINDPIKNEKIQVLKKLVFNKIQMVNDMLEQLGLIPYLNDTGIFNTLRSQGFVLPEAFWTAAKPFYPKLASLAQKLLHIPASSAQLERLFSSWSFIHSDLRNRLTVDRSEKLVSIYYSLKMNEKFDNYDYLIECE